MSAQSRAWAAVRIAILTGELVRSDTCEDCGATSVLNSENVPLESRRVG